MHVKGTKRSEPNDANEPSANHVPLNQNAANLREMSRTSSLPASRTESAPDNLQPNNFLEVFKKLEEQMVSMSTKLHQLDSNYAHLSQQQARPYTIPHHFQSPPPHYYPHFSPPPPPLATTMPPLRH